MAVSIQCTPTYVEHWGPGWGTIESRATLLPENPILYGTSLETL